MRLHTRFTPHSRLRVSGLVVAFSILATAADATQNFHHVGTFDVTTNGTEVAEIVDATTNGRTLIYSDATSIGFVDIRDPRNPLPDGKLPLDGEPTSVAVRGPVFALVGVNTSPGDEDDVAPIRSGFLAIVNLVTRRVVRTIDLGGQPDSIAISNNRRYAAVVVENERNEDLDDGIIPQDPPGKLVVVKMFGPPRWWWTRDVDLAGLAEVAPSDPEPEFVDINDWNQAVVSLQENNHFAIVDLRRAEVINHFSAGEVTIENIDATEEELGPQGRGLIIFNESQTKRREPDSVAWIDRDSFASANEGDYEDENGEEGGSRGFTVFNSRTGAVEYESFSSFEHAAAAAGHYNEGRSGNKGGEPEAVEYGKFARERFLFVGAERANVVGVYGLGDRVPRLRQLLPTGSGPEGIKVIPRRQLLVVAAENGEDGAFPSMITLYRLSRGAPSYPHLVSDDEASGTPIPWVAQSGLAGDLSDPYILYSVSDSFLAQSYIYVIDTGDAPARITQRIPVGGPDGAFDLEGIAADPSGGFWLASEGRVGDRPNELIRTDASGAIQSQVELPAALVANATNSGFEGVAVTHDGEFAYVVIQREWDDDPTGWVKIGRYETATGAWAFVRYPLDTPPAGGWVGLSEITRLPDGDFAIIERDNQLGSSALVKKIYRVDLANADFRPYDAADPTNLALIDKQLIRDALADLEANSIWTPDKFEGLAVAADWTVFGVTDNDGLDDALGQTLFLEFGNLGDSPGR
ncbi:MAG: esterase-like activity of phytase family protein [Myxococcales bacterium]|nr:esterase-like activity of phytase family protein [Myxococcales bacterium]